MNEAMLKMIVKGLGLDPEMIMGTIGGFGTIVVELQLQLARIEANQAEILAMLKASQNVQISNAGEDQ